MSRRRGGRRVNVVQGPRSYGGEGLGEVQAVLDGIEDVMTGVVQCASSCLSGLEDTPENNAEKENAMTEFHDVAVALAQAQEKLRIAPGAAADTFEYLEIANLAEREEEDEAFFGILDQFEEAAKVEEVKRFEEITEDVIEGNPMYRGYMEEMNKFVKRDGGKQSKRAALKRKQPVQEAPPADQQNAFSEGLEQLTDYVPTTDPITRKPLKDPVVNRKCNHVYENESIVGMLVASGTRPTRCPYPGCSNQMPITSDDLFRDSGLAGKIAEKIKGGVAKVVEP